MDTDDCKVALKCPYHIYRSEFSHCSVANTQLQCKNYSKQNIIIIRGGAATYVYNETTFVDVQLSLKDGNHVVEYKSFEKHYEKLNADLRMRGSTAVDDSDTDDDCSVFITDVSFHCFLLNNNKHLMVFDNERSIANVYDIEKDKWLWNKKDKYVAYSYEIDEDRAVFLTDEIFIISEYEHLHFYFIDKNDMAHPKLIKKYTIKADKIHYHEHGIVCTNLKIIHTNDTLTSLKFEIIVFGGSGNVFGRSFMKFNVDLSYNNITCTCSSDEKSGFIDKIEEIKPIIRIEEKPILIKSSMIVNNNCHGRDKNDSINIDKIILDQPLWVFGYQCLLNGKNEAVIIIVGGTTGIDVDSHEAPNQSIIVFNVATNTMQLKSKVLKYMNMLLSY